MTTKRITQETRLPMSAANEDIFIHGPLLMQIIRRRLWAWLAIGALAFAALLALTLWLLPQSYTATASVALQQPTPVSGLTGLLGGTGTDIRYIGVLKSREAAVDVENRVHLQQLYHLRRQSDALDLLMKGIKPEDSPTDGLLYIQVSLPAPPQLRPQTEALRTQIKQAAAKAANAYVDALRRYYATSDTDRESLLLRSADNEQRLARAGYDEALARMLSFSQGRDFDPRSASSSGDPLNGPPADLSGLYATLFQTQEQIREGEAAQAVQLAQRDRQLNSLSTLPSEDPLLTDARNRVVRDQAALKTLTAVYGPDWPAVISARTQLQADQAELDQQIQGLRSNLTTDQVQNKARMQGLHARQAEIQKQIAKSERRLGNSRRLSGEYGRLQQEVAFKVDILRTVNTEAEKVRLENVSAKSRMQVIDAAILPKKASPSLLIPIAVCLLLVGLGMLAALVRDYLAQVRLLLPALPLDYVPNGVVHETESENEKITAKT